MTIKETSKVLRIGLQLCYDMAKAGTLPGVRRLQRRYVVSKSELDRYLVRPLPILFHPTLADREHRFQRALS